MEAHVESASLRRRRRIYEIIEVGRGDDLASSLFDAGIVALILLNIAAFVVGTVPAVQARWGSWLTAFEVFSVAVFTIEYGLRLWTAVEIPFLSRMEPWKARLTLARQPALVIDLLAILPFYLSPILGLDLRVLRILRLLRFLKLARYSPAIHTLLRVLMREGRSLAAAALLLVAVLLISSTGMYHIEGHIQPDKLGTMPDAAYWAMTTLTTVGYGDVSPVTPLGKVWAMMTMVVGLCILALPVAIIATGFAQEVGRSDFVVGWHMLAGIGALKDLDARDANMVLPLLQAQSFPPHASIPAPDPVGPCMYFIVSGKVRAHGPDGGRDLGVGEQFATDCATLNRAGGFEFTSLSRCRLLQLYRSDFLRLEVLQPRIARAIRNGETPSPPATEATIET